ncbi:MAG: hypothetical protein WAL52_00155 [Candidatus Sulfotelmatobacter sp.]
MARRMTKFLVATLTLGFSAMVVAQQNSATQERPNVAPAAPNAEITIRGCVSGDKRYTFMQASTGEMFDLTGSTDRFAAVRGKLIEVTANEFAPSQNKPNGLPKLSVNKMQVVADKCPVQAHPEPSKPNSAWTNPQPPPPATSPATRPYADPGTVNQTPPNVNNPNTSGDTGSPSPGTGNPPPNPPR